MISRFFVATLCYALCIPAIMLTFVFARGQPWILLIWLPPWVLHAAMTATWVMDIPWSRRVADVTPKIWALGLWIFPFASLFSVAPFEIRAKRMLFALGSELLLTLPALLLFVLLVRFHKRVEKVAQ